MSTSHFTVTNFEGPLPFLLHLVQKSEIDLTEITILEIVEAYLSSLVEQQKRDVNNGAEFIDYASLLLWLKSKKLLPPSLDDEEWQELAEGSPLELLPQLIEYCQFKRLAKDLSKREEAQEGIFSKGLPALDEEGPRPLGLDSIELQTLFALFQEMMRKAAIEHQLIAEEPWRVADKIRLIREKLKSDEPFLFPSLFSETPGKIEVIVSFLAVLELMKLGELSLCLESKTAPNKTIAFIKS